jgi:hypothetical protein
MAVRFRAFSFLLRLGLQVRKWGKGTDGNRYQVKGKERADRTKDAQLHCNDCIFARIEEGGGEGGGVAWGASLSPVPSSMFPGTYHLNYFSPSFLSGRIQKKLHLSNSRGTLPDTSRSATKTVVQ